MPTSFTKEGLAGSLLPRLNGLSIVSGQSRSSILYLLTSPFCASVYDLWIHGKENKMVKGFSIDEEIMKDLEVDW